MKRLPRALGWATAALMVLASALGLLFPGVYRDPDWVMAAWFGNDLVTLAAVVPILVTGLLTARRGSRLGELLVYAGFAYSIYGYAYYLFGATLNVLLPVYVALVVVPLIGLAAGLGSLDAPALADQFRVGTPKRFAAGYMMVVGVGLGVAWLAQWAAYVFGGTEPAVGVDAFATIAALDLSLIVPFMVLGGLLLWRGRPWGYVLGAIYTVKGALYTLALAIGSAAGAARGVEGTLAQIPVWGAMSLVGVAAAVTLLRGLRHAAA
jgi:hypothetical protein